MSNLPWPCFPPEIFDSIVDLLHSKPEMLRRCSLVSRFRRMHLFAHIEFERPPTSRHRKGSLPICTSYPFPTRWPRTRCYCRRRGRGRLDPDVLERRAIGGPKWVRSWQRWSNPLFPPSYFSVRTQISPYSFQQSFTLTGFLQPYLSPTTFQGSGDDDWVARWEATVTMTSLQFNVLTHVDS